jgi:hypothetical protein
MNSPFPPSKRYSHNLAYDSESKVAILFGGMSGGRVNDTWAYKYQPNIPSAPLKLQASLIGGEVHLNWTSPKTDAGSPITEYVIYRGNSADDLTLFKTIQGKDTLEYIDADISKGGTYFYTVRAINAVGESKDSNIIEISIPNGVPGFSLLILSFSLVVYMMFKRK